MSTLYENLQGGSISDDPLTSGATTVNSTAFSTLPTVADPDVLYLTLDPEGANGAPEIVKVTAHTAAATSVTVVRAQQGTSAREHPVSSKWIHGWTKTDIDTIVASIAAIAEAGDIKATLRTSEATGWLNHNQTVAGADSSYPDLWAVAPAAWKSGSDLVIPDLTDVVLMGAGSLAAVGALAGANTATLTTSELPTHAHAGAAHTHPGAAHTHAGPNHRHSINHGHDDDLGTTTDGGHSHTSVSLSVSGTAAGSGNHGHGFGIGDYGMFDPSGSGGFRAPASNDGLKVQKKSFDAVGDHTHSTSGTASGTVGSTSSSHNHSISGGVTDHSGLSGYSGTGSTGAASAGNTGAASSGDTGDAGSGGSFSIVQRSLGVNIQIKT